jgi:hypothetical protein
VNMHPFICPLSWPQSERLFLAFLLWEGLPWPFVHKSPRDMCQSFSWLQCTDVIAGPWTLITHLCTNPLVFSPSACCYCLPLVFCWPVALHGLCLSSLVLWPWLLFAVALVFVRPPEIAHAHYPCLFCLPSCSRASMGPRRLEAWNRHAFYLTFKSRTFKVRNC